MNTHKNELNRNKNPCLLRLLSDLNLNLRFEKSRYKRFHYSHLEFFQLFSPIRRPCGPRKKATFPARLACSICGHRRLLSSQSSLGNISAKRMPLSLQICEFLVRRHISTFTHLLAKRMTTCLSFLSTLLPILWTTSTASSIFNSGSGATFRRISMTCSRMFSSLFSTKPLICRHHLILYLSCSLTLSFNSLLSLQSWAFCFSKSSTFSLHSFNSSALNWTAFAKDAIKTALFRLLLQISKLLVHTFFKAQYCL